jgi:hypothetical protein
MVVTSPEWKSTIASGHIDVQCTIGGSSTRLEEEAGRPEMVADAAVDEKRATTHELASQSSRAPVRVA